MVQTQVHKTLFLRRSRMICSLSGIAKCTALDSWTFVERMVWQAYEKHFTHYKGTLERAKNPPPPFCLSCFHLWRDIYTQPARHVLPSLVLKYTQTSEEEVYTAINRMLWRKRLRGPVPDAHLTTFPVKVRSRAGSRKMTSVGGTGTCGRKASLNILISSSFKAIKGNRRTLNYTWEYCRLEANKERSKLE